MSLNSQAPTTPRQVSRSANEYCLERWSALIGERLPDLVDLPQILNSVLPVQPAHPEEWISTVREVADRRFFQRDALVSSKRNTTRSANEYCLERWSALIGERLPDLVDLLQILNSVLPVQPAHPEEWISTVREALFGRHDIDWSLFQLVDHNDLFAYEFLETFESDGQIYVRVNEHVTRASVVITDSQNTAELYQFLKEQAGYKAPVATLTAYLGLSRGQLSEVASAPDMKSVFKIQKNVIELEANVLFLSLCD